jgi:aryl-alcohol dehydrogenase-like predicted oxidoreductase
MAQPLNSKIALGTVQFGLKYGISNNGGKVPIEEVKEIINLASASGIDTIDTAAAYGESEIVLGEVIADRGYQFKIVTKIPPGSTTANAQESFFNSLFNLGKKAVYGCLFHDFNDFSNRPEILNELIALKERKHIEKIGFSLYYRSQLDYLLDHNVPFDLLQIPYNVFDRRFESYFSTLKSDNVEIHVRSVFLQGLLLMKPEDLDDFFNPIKGKIQTLRELSKEREIPLNHLLLLFVLKNPYVDKVLIGVDSVANLKDNLDFNLRENKYDNLKSMLIQLEEQNEKILLPFNWKN